MKPATDRTWPKQRPKLSTEFDIHCHRFACAFVSLQSRELAMMQRENAGTLDQKQLNYMIQSTRKAQELGRMALGETTDRQQLELDLGPPNITISVVGLDARQ